MIAKKIKDLKSARYRFGSPSYSFTSRTMGVYITTSGGTASGSVSGQHVTEYSISVPGKSYTFNYWRPSSATQVCIAFLDANNTLLDAVYGGSSGQTSGVYTTPAGCTKVRIYGIYRQNNYVYATMTPTVTEGVMKLKEIRMKPTGASVSQVVWPTETTYQIIEARLRYSGGSILAANGGDFVMAYGDIRVTRGEDVTTLYDQILTPLRITPNDNLVIDGVDQQIYYISGNRVLAKDLKTAYAPYGTATTVIFGYMGQEVPKYVQQRRNIVESSGLTNKSYTGYRIELNNTDFTPSGGTATVTGYAQFTARPYESWTSGAVTYGSTVSGEEEQTPGSISVSPSGATISGTTITFPANTGSSEKVYTVTGRWSSYTATEYAYVYGTDTGKTYTDLRITSFDYPNSRIIPASGGSMYPTVAISIKCNGTTMTGSVSDGSTVCEVSGGGMTATVNLAYSGAPNGFVSANSLGTNETSSATLLASVSVTATKGSLSATSATRNVSQERNVKSVYSQGTYAITSMSVTPKIGSTAISGAIPAKSATVTLEILVSGSGTTTRYRYTSGAYSGGDTVTDTDKPLSQADLASLSVTSGGSSVTISDLEFTADNQHNLAAKTYSISATYEGTTRTASVQQAADRKIDGSATYYATLSEVSNQNTLWAGGGSVYVEASAYHIAGKVWESDGAAVTGESETTYDLDALRLVLAVDSASIFAVALDSTTSTSRIYRIDHRDMKNNATTDACSVAAINGNDPAASQATSAALTYSVTNVLETTEYSVPGEIVWRTPYQQYRRYFVNFAIANYTSGESPAPFLGGSTRYTAAGSHQEATFRDGVQPVPVYRHYSSWSSANDDDNHRYLVRTDENTYTETVSDWATVWGDTVSVGKQYASVDWVTVDESTQTITFAAQTQEGAPQRYTPIVATNTSAPNTVTASVTVWQQAYQMLYASPLTYNFDWQNPRSGIASITAWYVQFKIVRTGVWYVIQISFDAGATFEDVDYDATYGITTGALYPKLRILPTTNYGEEIRIGAVNLVPENAADVPTVRLRLEQEAYDGGRITN